jgi:two-component system, OmpR family, sensor histidine kinase KdpD
MTTPRRPDADELLARVEDEERRARRGKLTIFFGAAPGVGKTYAMLEAARSERDLRREVVVGVVETHGRYETAALTIGLELLPRRKLEHRGVKLEELDLDAVFARRPGLVLVDELAHTNAPGSRHVKRWQDVEEILDAGIDVYTTLNVQHIESLNDVIAQITGVIVRETVPDRIVDHADEIRLVDLTPEELLERLAEGKVYVPDQALVALTNFFRKGNLIALRELALRQTAERVDEQMRTEKRAEGIDRVWPVAERILVCISAGPDGGRLVRAGRRMATSLRAEWITVYVETPEALRMPPAERARVTRHLRLAESLGAEIVRLFGSDPADEVVHFARSRDVTKIVVGKSKRSRWRNILRRSFLDAIVRDTPDMDIYVITADERDDSPPRSRSIPVARRRGWSGPIAAGLAVAAATLVSFTALGRDQLPDVVMVYLFGIVLVSMRFGYRASIVAAILGILALDFFFLVPYGSFAVSNVGHFVTFTGMLVVALVVSHLSQRIRDQAEAVRRRESRTARLYAMNRELAGESALDAVLRTAVRHIGETFNVDVCVLLPSASGQLAIATSGPGTFELAPNDHGVPEWVWAKGKTAGLGTDTLPSASACFFVLRGMRAHAGVVGVKPKAGLHAIAPEHEQLLETFADEVASALERVRLTEEARRIDVAIEAERFRMALLSTISDDLQTPLGAITGATKALLEDDATLDVSTRRELVETTSEEAGRLRHLVQNLLEMTKIVGGEVRPRREPRSLASVIDLACRHLDRPLGKRRVDVTLPPGLPDVSLDPLLIEQVFVQLLENAIKFSPAGSSIDIGAIAKEDGIEVWVADRGPGVPRASMERVFEKFYRLRRSHPGEREESATGAGLGLAICRGIVEAHGGRIWVEEREGGGARFCFTLPFLEAASRATPDDHAPDRTRARA